ncbi:hypothetical protein JTE90_004680 [Oedothorax gibbosus]|uniref:Uncharacterized protein n=1 Tax=Oedothorax gibbosus TaxID=931172 RepID=A0AAV6UBT3_9ARAC|nr:hypothetical protein JTE90_004680 [Oedothorax gibbosus]
MCTLEPNKCDWNQSNFCNRYPKYCINGEDPMNAVPNHRYYLPNNYSFAYLNTVGQRKEDLLNYCVIFTDTPDSCPNIVSVPAVSRDGFPNTCFTVESLWGQPDAQPRSLPVASHVFVALKLHPEEYINSKEPVQAYTMVHDPRALVNPIRDGIVLVPGKIYHIYVSQTVIERLPAPYRTNCTDYLKLWRENGGRGPLTRKVSMQPVFGMEKLLKMTLLPAILYRTSLAVHKLRV